MKKKNALVVFAAAGLCMICVLLLVGSMGIYAEKSGTKEFEPELTDTEASDTLTKILTENTEKNDVQKEGEIPEEELQEIWSMMYEEYVTSEAMQEEMEEQEAEVRADFESRNVSKTVAVDEEMEERKAEDGTDLESRTVSVEVENENGGAIIEEDGQIVSLNTAELGVHEAGLILLKEINRLYPNDTLYNLKINDIRLYCDTGANSQGYIQWEGMLENGYECNDENYISYSFAIDSVSGKIISFGKFHPYQKDKDYSDISWTDDEIRKHAKELIEKYDLAEGEELDWNSVELFNGTGEIPYLKKELEEEPDLSVAVGNTLIFFKKDGKKCFYLCLDWETGEISDYTWPGRNMPE